MTQTREAVTRARRDMGRRGKAEGAKAEGDFAPRQFGEPAAHSAASA